MRERVLVVRHLERVTQPKDRNGLPGAPLTIDAVVTRRIFEANPSPNGLPGAP